MSSFQQKKLRHAKKKESTAHSHEKKKLTETVTGKTLDLLDDDFKSTALNMIKEIKKIID